VPIMATRSGCFSAMKFLSLKALEVQCAFILAQASMDVHAAEGIELAIKHSTQANCLSKVVIFA